MAPGGPRRYCSRQPWKRRMSSSIHVLTVKPHKICVHDHLTLSAWPHEAGLRRPFSSGLLATREPSRSVKLPVQNGSGEAGLGSDPCAAPPDVGFEAPGDAAKTGRCAKADMQKEVVCDSKSRNSHPGSAGRCGRSRQSARCHWSCCVAVLGNSNGNRLPPFPRHFWCLPVLWGCVRTCTNTLDFATSLKRSSTQMQSSDHADIC
jgi:hypothetical protein